MLCKSISKLLTKLKKAHTDVTIIYKLNNTKVTIRYRNATNLLPLK